MEVGEEVDPMEQWLLRQEKTVMVRRMELVLVGELERATVCFWQKQWWSYWGLWEDEASANPSCNIDTCHISNPNCGEPIHVFSLVVH